MKATIRRLSGDVVELEGLTDDVVRAVQALTFTFPPVYVPSLRINPSSPTWTATDVTPEPA